MNLWATLGLLFSIIIGAWKFFTGRKNAKVERAEKAEKMGREGVKNDDPSAITASLDRLRNDV